MSEPALAIAGLEKSYGATRALDGASLVVRSGEVHGLIGQNGAGKSTIIRILAGLTAPDAGTIAIGGVPVGRLTPRLLDGLGVHLIHQEQLLVPGFTVAEALFVGHELRRGPFLAGGRMRRAAEAAIASRFGIALAGHRLVSTLSAAERQVVQITRALLREARVLVLDEPTASLVRTEADRLFGVIRRLRETGTAIIYVSHYLEEVRALCDAVTILRNGRAVATVDPAATPVAAMVSLMIDRALADLFPARDASPGAPGLEVRGLGRAGHFAGINLTVRRGEIVGLTGLVGSGAKAVIEALFGLAPADTGTILVGGRAVRIRTPGDAVAHGLALVPEDRRDQGVSLDTSLLENVSLASLSRRSRLGLVDRGRERVEARRLIDRLGITSPGPDVPVRALSGGNQQKVVLAKWLGAGSTVYLLDEPTVAVDVAAKAEIYRLLGELAGNGAAILILSSDLLELRGLADRILVMARGRLVREVAGAEADVGVLLQGAGDDRPGEVVA